MDDRLREALGLHFQDMVERGEQLPNPETMVDHIDVTLPARRMERRQATATQGT